MKQRIKTAAALSLALALAGTAGIQAAAAPPEQQSSVTANIQAGTLKLADVPSLDFGTNSIDQLSTGLDVAHIDGELKVADHRGSAQGWKVTATLSELESMTERIRLSGTELSLSGQTVNAADGTQGSAPSAPAPVRLACGSETAVWEAAAGTGMGSWAMKLSPAGTKLADRSGAARPDHYTGTITWTLQAAP